MYCVFIVNAIYIIYYNNCILLYHSLFCLYCEHCAYCIWSITCIYTIFVIQSYSTCSKISKWMVYTHAIREPRNYNSSVYSIRGLREAFSQHLCNIQLNPLRVQACKTKNAYKTPETCKSRATTICISCRFNLNLYIYIYIFRRFKCNLFTWIIYAACYLFSNIFIHLYSTRLKW